MRFFAHKALRLGNGDRELLSLIIEEGNKLFALPVASPYVWNKPNKPKHPLTRKEKPEFGAEQLIKIYMEALFIRLIRVNQARATKPKLSSVTKEKGERDLASRVMAYLEDHLPEHPTLDRICAEFAASKTRLRAVFREQTGFGITEYIGRLRIERAKGMAPSEYLKTVKAQL